MAMMDARLAEWFASGDTGISSEGIALWLGARVKQKRWDDTPSDGADFGRCYRLMKAVPEFRERIGEMAERGGKWPTLVRYWDEVEAIYEREVAGEVAYYGRTYKRMKEIEIEAYREMGWTVELNANGDLWSASAPKQDGAA